MGSPVSPFFGQSRVVSFQVTASVETSVIFFSGLLIRFDNLVMAALKAASEPGTGAGASGVGGSGVAVGGSGVAVGGSGVAVGGSGVEVGGSGVAVGG
jgi:hypothetical protein